VGLTITSGAPEDAKAKASQIEELARMSRKIDAPNVIIDEYNESSQE
jgi:disease resistance protein RPM1